MAKRIKALVLAAVLVLSLVAVPGVSFNSYAVDATTSASAPWPATPTTPTTPTTPKAPTTPTTPTTPVEPTAPVAPVVSEYKIPTITRVLYFGTKGPDVETLQRYLNKLGSSLEVDGMFGNLTLAEVKAFQTKSGLVVDGYVGKLTNAALYDAAGGTDVVTTASLVNDIDAFKAGISADGKWIVSVLRDLVSEEELVLDGTFKNGKKDKVTGEDIIQRKISLYTQDENRVVLERFTLTAPKLTVNSPNARIQSGTFKGDVYVNAEGFQLVDATVEGNVYYTTQAAKDTANIDAKSKVTGEVALVEIIEGTDVVTTASLTYENEVFRKSMWGNGTWIISSLKDMTFDKPLVLAGEFTYRDRVQRKIAPYSQATVDGTRVITRRFTITAPSLTILSPNARFQGGIFVGDIYVSAENFQIVDATVIGNIYFTTQEAKDTYNRDSKSVLEGEEILTQLDAVVSPSLYRTADELHNNVSAAGTWIAYAGNDVKTDKEILVTGEFTYRDTIQRKIAPYSQSPAPERKVTRRFTITAPKMTIESPNTRFEKGDFVGDVYVTAANFRFNEAIVTGNVYVSDTATGFKMDKTTINGNVYYATQEVKDAAIIDAASVVTGVSEVK